MGGAISALQRTCSHSHRRNSHSEAAAASSSLPSAQLAGSAARELEGDDGQGGD